MYAYLVIENLNYSNSTSLYIRGERVESIPCLYRKGALHLSLIRNALDRQ